jgi:hypothetical protein
MLNTRTAFKSGGKLVYIFGAVILFRVTVFTDSAQVAKKASIVQCSSVLISRDTYSFDNLYSVYSTVMWAVQTTSLVREPNLIHLQLPLKNVYSCSVIPLFVH